jgi:hypothetical protein
MVSTIYPMCCMLFLAMGKLTLVTRNTMLRTNDLVNPNPGGPKGFDPRHVS